MRQAWILGMVVCVVAPLAGCQQSLSSRLEGEWRGRPDTAAAAAERSKKLKAKQNEDEQTEDAFPGDKQPAADKGKTDLEQHDVTIELNFKSDKTISMSLGDGSQPLTGVWRILQTLPPRGAEIEITSQPAEQPAEKTSPEDKTVEQKRRFVIDFQGDNAADGFTLVEKGADPKFGRLYFTPKP